MDAQIFQQGGGALHAEVQQEVPGSMILFDLRELTHFRDDQPYIQVLSDTGAARVVLFAFKAGQQLKSYKTGSQLLVQALRGSVTLSTAGNSVKLRAGMVLQVEENVPFDVTAPNSAVVLLTMTPSPTQQSEEGEITRSLVPLVARV
ncbi:MAG TPA: hypothetical protein VHZ51_24515 [Ktedonobacteraceae bacterium]|jgi:quercetin dioxygenase-like cupin family protein|nr:hypothetical protein [Ktedonobacteraceae bacterium]